MEDMVANSQPRLTWNSPELRLLHERYWAKHERDFSQADFSYTRHSPIESDEPLMRYCVANGYLHTPEVSENLLLDNEIHPILARENWLIECDPSIDWFVHLRYGDLSVDEFGRLYIKTGVKEQSELLRLRALVKKELRAFAGSIRFTWLSSHTPGLEWFTRFAGLTKSSIKGMMKLYEDDLEISASLSSVEQETFQGETSTVCFPIDLYYTTLAGHENPVMCQNMLFRRYLCQAITLVHEIVHAVGNLWGLYAGGIEVLHSHSDTFPELGLSWERHMVRGKIACDTVGPAIVMKMEDCFPTDGQITSTPLRTYLKMDYVNQFFLKSTWKNLEKVRENLYAPTIDQSQEFFLFGRFVEDKFAFVVYIDQRSVSDDHLFQCLQEQVNIVVTWEQNAARRYHLDEIVQFYREIWKQEEADGLASGLLLQPHFYLHITKAWASFENLGLSLY